MSNLIDLFYKSTLQGNEVSARDAIIDDIAKQLYNYHISHSFIKEILYTFFHSNKKFIVNENLCKQLEDKDQEIQFKQEQLLKLYEVIHDLTHQIQIMYKEYNNIMRYYEKLDNNCIIDFKTLSDIYNTLSVYNKPLYNQLLKQMQNNDYSYNKQINKNAINIQQQFEKLLNYMIDTINKLDSSSINGTYRSEICKDKICKNETGKDDIFKPIFEVNKDNKEVNNNENDISKNMQEDKQTNVNNLNIKNVYVDLLHDKWPWLFETKPNNDSDDSDDDNDNGNDSNSDNDNISNSNNNDNFEKNIKDNTKNEFENEPKNKLDETVENNSENIFKNKVKNDLNNDLNISSNKNLDKDSSEDFNKNLDKDFNKDLKADLQEILKNIFDNNLEKENLQKDHVKDSIKDSIKDSTKDSIKDFIKGSIKDLLQDLMKDHTENSAENFSKKFIDNIIERINKDIEVERKEKSAKKLADKITANKEKINKKFTNEYNNDEKSIDEIFNDIFFPELQKNKKNIDKFSVRKDFQKRYLNPWELLDYLLDEKN